MTEDLIDKIISPLENELSTFFKKVFREARVPTQDQIECQRKTGHANEVVLIEPNYSKWRTLVKCQDCGWTYFRSLNEKENRRFIEINTKRQIYTR